MARERRTAPLAKLADRRFSAFLVRVMKYILLLVTILVVAAHNVYADSPRTPFPYIVTAGHGNVYFSMFPRSRPGNHSHGFGIAYRIGDNGSDVELWRTPGWYSTEVFLSNDGDFLVMMGRGMVVRNQRKRI